MAEKELENCISADMLLRTALDIGEHLLICGGDIRRVEDTIIRVCKAFGAEHTEAFTITSFITASVRMPDGSFAQQMRRVYESSNDLAALEALNDISRRLCAHTITLEEAQQKIRDASRKKPYPRIVYYLGTALAAGGFAVFFGGTLKDGVAAALVGILITMAGYLLPKSANQMVRTLFNSFWSGLCVVLLVHLGIGDNEDMVMIGVVMLLIPGVAMGISLQDMLSGDVLSGTIRFLQAILLAVMIALGFSLALYLLASITPPTSVPGLTGNAVMLVTSFIGTAGFSIIFSTNLRHLPYTALGGVISLGGYLLVFELLNGDLFIANAAGAFLGGMYSHICARLRTAPHNIFTVACMIPLVPGSALYYTMRTIVTHDQAMAAQYGNITLQTALGIAGGLLISSVAMYVFKWFRRRTCEK